MILSKYYCDLCKKELASNSAFCKLEVSGLNAKYDFALCADCANKHMTLIKKAWSARNENCKTLKDRQ